MKFINTALPCFEEPELKELELNIEEVRILRHAYIICEKADKLLRPSGDEEEDYNKFSYAAGELGEILEEYA